MSKQTMLIVVVVAAMIALTPTTLVYAQDPNPDKRPVEKPIKPPGEALATQCPENFEYNRDTRQCEGAPDIPICDEANGFELESINGDECVKMITQEPTCPAPPHNPTQPNYWDPNDRRCETGTSPHGGPSGISPVCPSDWQFSNGTCQQRLVEEPDYECSVGEQQGDICVTPVTRGNRP